MEPGNYRRKTIFEGFGQLTNGHPETTITHKLTSADLIPSGRITVNVGHSDSPLSPLGMEYIHSFPKNKNLPGACTIYILILDVYLFLCKTVFFVNLLS